MNEPPPTKILISAAQAETARRWTRALEAAGVEIRCQATPDYRPELIVTDLADIPASEAGDPGVVRVGTDGPGDVRLPADCTDRELCLACRLLAQIVRLRRRAIQSAEIHRELSAQAMTDPLTGLPNRRAWDAALPERLALAGRRSQLCLAILDLDHFKQINDSHGHAIGDEVLRATGVAINDNLRQDDFVARLGGDEFGLLLWVPDEEVAAAVVERVRAALPEGFSRTVLPNVTASAGYQLTGTCGASAPLPSSDAFYMAADAALREAKRRGRNCTVGPGDDDPGMR